MKDVRKEHARTISETRGSQRISDWSVIVDTLAKQEWAHELKQIPATVIDTGVLANVPYISFRCNSGGYEINVYGDPDDPAGVEIGTLGYLLKNPDAKKNCSKFIESVLVNQTDRDKTRALNLDEKDVKKQNGLTFETTMPSESDSYGGWWVSVYDEAALAKARASGRELLSITEPRPTPNAKSVTVAQPKAVVSTARPVSSWSPTDLTYARPSVGTTTTGGGRVYVRGYFRKDGTYVHAHTRSSPRRH